jgi:polyisoprenoid-binding protein YceI
MKKLAFLYLALAFSGAAFGASGSYVIDPLHSFARFEYNHWGYTTVGGRFDKTSGKIAIDTDKKTGSVDVVIDARSVSAGSDEFNTHLQGPDYFDTAKHPTITFKSNTFTFEGDRLDRVEGDLTIKSITKPVTLVLTSFLCKMHPLFKKDYCGANATAKIKRSDFNAGKYAPFVADEVLLSISLEAASDAVTEKSSP